MDKKPKFKAGDYIIERVGKYVNVEKIEEVVANKYYLVESNMQNCKLSTCTYSVNQVDRYFKLANETEVMLYYKK